MKRAVVVLFSSFLALTPTLSPSQSVAVPILPTTIRARSRATLPVGHRQSESGTWHNGIPMLPRAGADRGSNAIPSFLTSSPSRIFLTAPTYSSSGQYARSVALADVNHDGKPDLIVANEFATNFGEIGTVGVLLGNGDGTFQPAVTYGYNGDQASSVIVADINRDGKPDILVGIACATLPACDTGGVAVLLGNGDGTFQPAVTYSSGQYDAQALALADVNGDGKPDLLITYYCNLNNCPSTDGGVAVLIGNGDGTFQPPVTYDSGGYGTTSLAVGDVNGDGKLDLLLGSCSSSGNCEQGGGVSVLLGNGDGTFQPASKVFSGAQPLFVSVADLNRDGRLDLLVGECLNSTDDCAIGGVVVLLGKGNGTFHAPVTYASGGQSVAFLAVADVNGDGVPDLLVTNECVSYGACDDGSVAVLLGNGNGTFRAASAYDSIGNDALSLAVGDVNGDGKPDLLVANYCANSNDCDNGTVAVALGIGNGSFQTAASYNSGGYDADAVTVGDLNGDGKPDLVVSDQCATGCGNSSSGSVGVLLGNGNGTFQKTMAYASGGFGAQSVAIGDVNGDGKLDVVVGNECASIQAGCGSFSTTGSIGVLLNNGDGTLQPAVLYDSGAYGTTAVTLADVNGDHKLDLLVANQCFAYGDCDSGSVSILLGNGDGTFQPPVTYSSGGSTNSYGVFALSSIAVADVNGDGKPDLLVTSEYAANTQANGSVGLLLGNGDGTFQPVVAYNSGGQYAFSLAIGDVNGDGKLDVVVANQCVTGSYCSSPSEGSIGVLLGNGDGTFQSAASVVTPEENDGALALADFNGDGNLDVASGAGGVLLLGNGDGTFQPALALGIFGTGIAVGDFNHDGRPDLAAGGVTVLLNISNTFSVPTTTILASSKNPSNVGQSATLTALVVSTHGTPTGAVTFMDASTVIATKVLNGGKASLAISGLSTGSTTFTAVYGGTPLFAASTSAPLSQSVLVPTTTTISSSSNPSVRGQKVTFTAVVTSTAGAPPDGEIVTFVEDLTVLGTKKLIGGTAALTTTSLPPGASPISAVYGGDSNFTQSASPWLRQVISKPLPSNQP